MTKPSDISVDPVTQYALDVVETRIIAGPHVRAACRRHLKDIEHGPARGIFFDLEAVDFATGFFRDVLRLNGGEWEGVPYELLGWQAFVVGSLWGWKNAEGFRRFRTAYIETGKGSGKSPLAAGIGLMGLCADEEPRAEVYAAATKKDQAMILFRDAVAMVDQSPELARRIIKSGVGEKCWNLAFHSTGSFFRPVSADDGQSGPRPHIALMDEIHEHKTRTVVDTMRAGTKGRRQALMLMITNSGVDKNSVCRSYHDYAAKVCAGQLEDDSFFGYVCALDPEVKDAAGKVTCIADDPFKDPACWAKANPSLGVTIQPSYLEEQVREARGMPAKEANVRRLNFCQWVEAHNPWLSAEIWLRAGAEYTLQSLRGRECYGGLDLSAVLDLTAFALLFPPSRPGEKWKLLVWFWLPEDGLAKREELDRVPYLAWTKAGWLETTPGKAIDERHVIQRVAQICAEVKCTEIGYDRWRIKSFENTCSDEGIAFPLVEFGQGFKDMAPAVSEFERKLANSEIEHNNNPVLTWNAANAVVDEDPAGNKKVTKERATGRVDGIVAALMAIGRASLAPDEGSVDDWLRSETTA